MISRVLGQFADILERYIKESVSEKSQQENVDVSEFLLENVKTYFDQKSDKNTEQIKGKWDLKFLLDFIKFNFGKLFQNHFELTNENTWA